MLNFDEIGRLGGPRSPNQLAHDRAFSGIDTLGPPIQAVRPKLRLMFSTLIALPCNLTTLHGYFCSLKEQDLKFMNLVSVFDQGVRKSRKTNVSESFIVAVRKSRMTNVSESFIVAGLVIRLDD